MLEQPVFIGGMYKSGTTLLRMMLSQHSDMVSGLETFWFDLNWEDRNSGRTEYVGRRWDGTRDEAPGDQIERLCRYYGLDPVAHADRIDACSSREEFLDFLLTTYAATCGAGRWTEKTPPNILHWERVFRAWPDARLHPHGPRSPGRLHRPEADRQVGHPGGVRQAVDTVLFRRRQGRGRGGSRIVHDRALRVAGHGDRKDHAGGG